MELVNQQNELRYISYTVLSPEDISQPFYCYQSWLWDCEGGHFQVKDWDDMEQ